MGRLIILSNNNNQHQQKILKTFSKKQNRYFPTDHFVTILISLPDDMFAQAARAEVLQLFKRDAECSASVQKMYRSVMDSFHSNKSQQLFHNAHEPVTSVFNILMDNNLHVEALEYAIATLSSTSTLPPGKQIFWPINFQI